MTDILYPEAKAKTFRQELHESVVQTAYLSIGGSPWDDETETALSALRAAIDAAIDGNRTLGEIFDRMNTTRPPTPAPSPTPAAPPRGSQLRLVGGTAHD